MCQKLGKKHKNYADRNANLRDKEGKRRRNWNGTRVINLVYGHNALNAYTDLRDKMDGGEQWTEGHRIRPVKAKRLERMYQCQSNQRASGMKIGPHWYARKQKHLKRNNVTVNKRKESQA